MALVLVGAVPDLASPLFSPAIVRPAELREAVETGTANKTGKRAKNVSLELVRD